jgi:uncharacterized protein (TIGR02246 family)
MFDVPAPPWSDSMSPADAAKIHALRIVDQWIQAFAASDVDGIVKLYAPDALFIGTSSTTVVTETAGIRQYFEQALLTRRPRGAVNSDAQVLVLSDDTVLVTALNTTTGVNDGQPFCMAGRVSFVITRRNDTWKIVHFHRSAMPG